MFLWLFVWMKCFQGDLISVSLPPVNQRTGLVHLVPTLQGSAFHQSSSLSVLFPQEQNPGRPTSQKKDAVRHSTKTVKGDMTRDAAVWKCETFRQVTLHSGLGPPRSFSLPPYAPGADLQPSSSLCWSAARQPRIRRPAQISPCCCCYTLAKQWPLSEVIPSMKSFISGQ